MVNTILSAFVFRCRVFAACNRIHSRCFFGNLANFLNLTFQIKELLPLQKKYMDLKAQLELKLYDLSLFQGRAEQNEHHKVSIFPLSFCNFYAAILFLQNFVVLVFLSVT